MDHQKKSVELTLIQVRINTMIIKRMFLFPQAQADIWKQVGQRGQALDEWSFQQEQTKEDYKNQVKYQTDSYKNQILAFEKSNEIYNKKPKVYPRCL